MKVLFLFIDGVGLRAAATDNPVNPEVCPALCRLITKHGKPIDARLGIDGPPQSATGQATMFAGVNCAAAMGKHCEGFPGPNLRKIIETDNLFKQLRSRGKEVCFSDAYLVDSAEELAARRFKSVTTVMALTTPETIRTVDDLQNGQAVMQDLSARPSILRPLFASMTSRCSSFSSRTSPVTLWTTRARARRLGPTTGF